MVTFIRATANLLCFSTSAFVFLAGAMAQEPRGEDWSNAVKYAERNSQAIARLDVFDIGLTSESVEGGGPSYQIRWRKNGTRERLDTFRAYPKLAEGEPHTAAEVAFFDHMRREMKYFAQRPAKSLPDAHLMLELLPYEVPWGGGYEAWEAPHARKFIHHAAVIPLMFRICQVAQDDLRTLEELVKESLGVRLQYDGADPILVIRHPGVDDSYVGEELEVVLSAANGYVIRKVVSQSTEERWRTIVEASGFHLGDGWALPKFITITSGVIENGEFSVNTIRTYEVTINSMAAGPVDASFRFPDNAMVKALPSPVVVGGSAFPTLCNVNVYAGGRVERVVTPGEFESFIVSKLGDMSSNVADDIGHEERQPKKTSGFPTLWLYVVLVVALTVGAIAWKRNQS